MQSMTDHLNYNIKEYCEREKIDQYEFVRKNREIFQILDSTMLDLDIELGAIKDSLRLILGDDFYV